MIGGHHVLPKILKNQDFVKFWCFLTEPFFSERIKKHDQINGNLFLGFSAWKWLDWKVGINDLPLFLQSNPTAFYFLLFRPHKARFSMFVTNICFFLLNFVLQTASFTCFDHISSCYTSSAFVNVAISSKKKCEKFN